MKHRLLILAMVLLACPVCLARNEPHVKATLIADVDRIQPGKPFTVAVVFDIDLEWHIYWKNPGDAGQATRVKLSVPEGFTVGEIRYPTPKKFAQAGDIVAYGYENQTALLATITPPDATERDPNKPTEISAAVSWLVCSDVCIPGKADLKLILPGNKPDAALIAQYAAQVPADLTDEIGTAVGRGESKIEGNHTNVAVTVDITWKQPPAGDGVFLRGSSDTYNFTNAKITTDGKTMHVQFTAQTLAGKKPDVEKLETVLSFPNSTGATKAVRFWVSLPDGNVTAMK